MLTFSEAHNEVVWLYVPVQIQPRVDVLDSLNELVCKHQRCFKREFATASPEQLLQTAPKLVHHEAISLLVLAKPMDLWDSDPISQDLIDFVLIHEL